MAERATVTQAAQVGVETTPGTTVAASKLLKTISFDIGAKVDMQDFRPSGQKYPSIETPGKEWSALKIDGAGSYTEIVYLLSSIGVAVAPVQQGGTTAYKWTHTPAARTEDTVKTFTIEKGGAVRAHKIGYGLITDLSMEYSRAGVDIKGGGIGQLLQDGIAMTAAPTAIDEQPIIPNQVDIFMDTTSAGLGTTKLLRVLKASWSLGNRFNPLWTLNSANTSYAAHVEGVPGAQVKLTVEADSLGMAILTQMRAGTTSFCRIKATSPVLAGTAIPYSLTQDFALKVADVSEFSDVDGVYAVEWTFDIVYDPTWTKAFEIAAINQQTAL